MKKGVIFIGSRSRSFCQNALKVGSRDFYVCVCAVVRFGSLVLSHETKR